MSPTTITALNAEEHETAPPSAQDTEDTLVVEDLLVEDVSIDGMCGVY
jgi:mycofactocin precursor